MAVFEKLLRNSLYIGVKIAEKIGATVLSLSINRCEFLYQRFKEADFSL